MDKVKAYHPVITDQGWSVGIAVWGEMGYTQTDYFFKTEDQAEQFCDRANEHLGINEKQAFIIVTKTMFPGCTYTLEDVIKEGRES